MMIENLQKDCCVAGQLFETTTDNIGLHLKNIYSENELTEGAATEDFSVVQNERKRAVRRAVKFYNLDTIIAVGYRVSSKQQPNFVSGLHRF